MTPRVVAELTDATAWQYELMDSLFRSNMVYIGISGQNFLILGNCLNQGQHILFVQLRARFEYFGLGGLKFKKFFLVVFEVLQICNHRCCLGIISVERGL